MQLTLLMMRGKVFEVTICDLKFRKTDFCGRACFDLQTLILVLQLSNRVDEIYA